MSPTEIRSMPSGEIVEMLSALRPGSDQAIAWLAAVLADNAAVEGVNELARRYHAASDPSPSTSASGRYVGAMTVKIDPERWCAYFFARRLALNAVGPLFNRCEGWASVIKRKRHAGFYALDELATALSERVEDFIHAVGTDEERERLATAL